MRDKNKLFKSYRSDFLFLMSHVSSPKGFTLIELLVVFGVIGILTAIGIASYSSYTNNQSVQSASSDVLNMLTTAKSRALSQVKPSQCGTDTLSGYEVIFSSPHYTMQVVCGDRSYVMKTQDLPYGVSFAAGSAPSVLFKVSQGTSTPATVTISGYGKNKNITVTATGNMITN